MSTKYFLLFIVSLSLLLLLRLLTFKDQAYKAGEEVIIEETLLSEPRIKGSTQQFWVGERKVLVITARFPKYHYADTLAINSTLEERVIDKNNSILIAYFPKIEFAPNADNAEKFLLAVSSSIRQKVGDLFRTSLPSTSTSLLLGIVFGVREGMPDEFYENLQKTGTLHVIAASGMNVSMVGGFLASFLVFFVRRQIALILTIISIFFYAFLAGFEPSIVRAAIMGSIAFSALILGRQNLSFLSLFLAGFIMLMLSPPTLFDIGFQLSFLATLSLIILKPLFDAFISRMNLPQFLGLFNESFTTTLSAQLGTLPILLANFGTFSPVSILANTLILWTVPSIMVIGFFSAVLGFITDFLAAIILQLSLPFLLLFEAVVNFFGQRSINIEVADFPFIMALGYYLLLIAFVIFLKQVQYGKK